MLRELKTYHRPGSLRDALQLLQQPHGKALAGGTELLGRNEMQTYTVVDLQDAGLDYVRSDERGTHIGAMTRLRSFVEHPPLNTVAGSSLQLSAMLLTASERNAATIGGCLAAAGADDDLLTALLVVDAEVEIQTASARTVVALADLAAGRTALLTQGALITELTIPVQPAGARFSLERISRTPADRAILCVAARMAAVDGKLSAVRFSAGGAAAHALRLRVAETTLEGARLDAMPVADAARAGQAESAPASDHRASAEYRRAMLGILLSRIVSDGAGALRSERRS